MIRIKDNVKVTRFDAEKYLTEEFMGTAIVECLINNDPEGTLELIEIYLEECNNMH